MTQATLSPKEINENGNLRKEIDRKDATIAKLNKDLEKIRVKSDQHDARAKSLQKEKNALELKLDETRAKIRNDDPIGKGAYEVRTLAAQQVNGRTKPAGTLLGFFTTVQGFEPTMLADALHYRSAVVKPADQHELFTELMGRADATEKLASAENRIAELEKELAVLLELHHGEDGDGGGEGGDGGGKSQAAE